jgi:D-beta-D-heptose 7-phosphate kinase/D-beta-D-heptose 1-phosphate adenosyltransferase
MLNDNFFESDNQLPLGTSKIIYENEIDKLVLFQNKNVVFISGCFDIIHSNHLKLINFSKKQGDIFIVGLASDSTVKKHKGDNRPINDINERVEHLINLNIIDYIVIFDDNSYNIQQYIKPNVVVKGSDYTTSNMTAYEFSKKIIYKSANTISTSSIINKINKMNK